MSTKAISRRDFLKLASMTTTGVALAACAAQATPTANPPEPTSVPVEPTAANPTATTAAVEPTATAAAATSASSAAINWDIYPNTDPRHWVLDKPLEFPKKYDGMSISTNLIHWGEQNKPGETPDDNVFSRWIKEQTGVTFPLKWSTADPLAQWATALAANDLPEFMVQVPGDIFAQLLEADVLMDIGDIYDKTANDFQKQNLAYPDGPGWKYVSKGGKKYGLPGNWGGGLSSGDVYWYRQDWLDKLGMKVPETLDEVHEVGMAFKKAGLAEIGISLSSALSGWGGLQTLFGAFGYVPTQWMTGAEGQLFYSSTDPSVKEALAYLQGWYKDGMFEADYAKSNDGMRPVTEVAAAGKSGINPSPYWQTTRLNQVQKIQPDAKWTYGVIPAGPSGKRGVAGDPGFSLCSCFLKGTDPLKVEAVVNQQKWVLDIYQASRCTTNWPLRFEGYDYNIDDKGEYKAGQYRTYYFRYGGFEATMQGPSKWEAMQFEKMAALLKADPEGKTWNPLERFLVSNPEGKLQSGAALLFNQHKAEWSQYTTFVWPPPTSVAEAMAALSPKEAEVFHRIITGKDPVTAWDQWVSDWKKGGGDTATATMNEAYQELTK